MKLPVSSSDERVLTELGGRIARARIDANLTQAALAREAGVSKRTLERLEAGQSTQLTNLLRVLRALGLLERIDALVPDAVPSPVQQLELEGRTRERASRQRAPRPPAKPWTWADD